MRAIADLWPLFALAGLFVAAIVAGCLRIAAAADRQQERQLSIAEARIARLRADGARCPWPLKSPNHAQTNAGEEQQSAV